MPATDGGRYKDSETAEQTERCHLKVAVRLKRKYGHGMPCPYGKCSGSQSSAEQNSMMRARADCTGVVKSTAAPSSRRRTTRSRSASPGRPASDRRKV